jgi:anti-sigma factor RsiW
MDCSEVKQLLSAYYDDELSSGQRTAVAEHLSGCADCSRELEGFHSLSAMTEGLAHPEPPAHIWQQLEEQLNVDHARLTAGPAGHVRDDAGYARPVGPAVKRWSWTRKPVVRLGLAAAAAILIAVGWIGYRTWTEHADDHQFAVVFGQYLDEFRRDPQAAQQILLTKYEGQAVDAEQAERAVGYRPAAAAGMPEGYSIESTYVMKMPCCTCVQTLCKRSDGSMLAIFEHDDENSNWFGDRPENTATCGGKQCGLIDLDDRIAVSWKHGRRHITAIGVRNIAEANTLVAALTDNVGHTMKQ